MQSISYYQRHKERIKTKLRRTRLTTTDGRVLRGLHKRPYPKACEWCVLFSKAPQKPPRLVYHHWDDKYPSMGLWLCHRCHHVAGLMDQPQAPTIMTHYRQLKLDIEKAYGLQNRY